MTAPGFGNGGEAEHATAGIVFAQMIHAALPQNHGERCWASPAMVELCLAASPKFQECPLAAFDLPWPSATIVLGSNISAPSNSVESLNVISWSPGLVHLEQGGAGDGIYVVCWGRHPEAGLIPALCTSWGYGENPTGRGDGVEAAMLHRTLFAFWSMLRDRIALKQRAPAPRPSARRWQRQIGQAPEEVTVITLRRPSTEHAADRSGYAVDWTHRWIVGGHWRNQWYPSLQAHRPKWIAPHVKGPGDKPLKVKDRVYAWTR